VLTNLRRQPFVGTSRASNLAVWRHHFDSLFSRCCGWNQNYRNSSQSDMSLAELIFSLARRSDTWYWDWCIQQRPLAREYMAS